MTLQLPALRVHVVELNVPAALVLKLTEPVGVTAPAPDESATVAVQVLAWLTVTDDGEHDTVVEDDRIVDVTTNEPLLAE